MLRILFLLSALAFGVAQASPIPIYSVTAQNSSRPVYFPPTGSPDTVVDAGPTGIELQRPDGTLVPISGINQPYTFLALGGNILGQIVCRNLIGEGDDFLTQVMLVQPGGATRILATSPESTYYFPSSLNLLEVSAGGTVSLYWDNILQSEIYDGGIAAIYYQGKAVSLGSLGTPLGTRPASSNATAINDFGVVVGISQIGLYDHAGFVYLNGTMYDLNTLVNATGQGLTITSATNINDFGQILATALDATGASHSVVLTVVGLSNGSNVLK